jgi:TRAP-type C4-dicarboxylate transport system permease large subunit
MERMDKNAIAALVITGFIGLLLVAAGIVLLTGRGSFLIAGYNTMSANEKKKYNAKSLCKFMGKIILPIGLLTPSVAIGGIYGVSWIPFAYVAIVVALAVFAGIYANTGNRFKQ